MSRVLAKVIQFSQATRLRLRFTRATAGKSALYVGLFLAALATGFIFTLQPAAAAPDLISFTTIANGIIWAFTHILLALARLGLSVMVFFLQLFIQLAAYNNFIDAPPVVIGWLMVRDVANMFFVVALLVIAFGTILGLEQYEWKKTLMKLILAAIFINFSKLILQLVIDVAHVFTTTFLNAIVATAGGNLISMFHLDQVLNLTPSNRVVQGDDLRLDLLIGGFMAVIFSIMALVIIGAYLIVMLIRMVVLWVLIILSPLAFIAQVLPNTKSYAEEYWKEFTHHVIVAPVMVFFLWLTFATLGSGDIASVVAPNLAPADAQALASQSDLPLSSTISLSEATTWENFASFMIALGFLYVGLDRVQKLGVKGGGIVSGAVNFGKKVAAIATGYAAGRYLLYDKALKGGVDLAGKGLKGALYHAPLVGGQKWELRGKLIGQAVKDWYYQKGYALTKEGEKKRIEAEGKQVELQDINQQISKAETEEQKQPLLAKKATLEGKIKQLEDEMAEEGAGGPLGYFARKGIQLEKQVSKTEKKAGVQREVLWKRVGSEAGGVLFKTKLGGLLKKDFEIGIGAGTKGIFGAFGDRYRKDEDLARIVYGDGIVAQDRVERGWLQAEEARSKAKDEEFEGLGKRQGLYRARLKFDVKDNKLTFQVTRGSLQDQVASHKLGAETHAAAVKRLENQTRLGLVLGVGKPATVQGGYQEFLREQSLSHLKQLETASKEQGSLKLEEVKERIEASEVDSQATNLERQAERMHDPIAQKFIDEAVAIEEGMATRANELRNEDDLLEKLETSGADFNKDNKDDRRLLEHLEYNKTDFSKLTPAQRDEFWKKEDQIKINQWITGQKFLEKISDRRKGFATNVVNFKKQRAENIVKIGKLKETAEKLEETEDEAGIQQVGKEGADLIPDGVIKQGIQQELSNPSAVLSRIKSLRQAKANLMNEANARRQESPAWRYAAAKANEGLAIKLDLTSHQALLSDAEQREVYDKRGLETPRSAFGELGEIFKKQFADMSVQSYLANLGPMLKKMHKRRARGLGVAEEQIDRAISMGAYLHGFGGSWLDDNVYATRPTPEQAAQFQYYVDWDPDDNVSTLPKLGNIHDMYASGIDMEYVGRANLVRRLIGEGKNVGLTPKEVFTGLRTGDFGNARLQIEKAIRVPVQSGGFQAQIVEQVFGNDAQARQDFYDKFMKKLKEIQSEAELMANKRDEALGKKHGENAGWYQNFEVEDGVRLHIPVAGEMAEEYVLGDANKMEAPDRQGQHYHAWADVEEGGKDIFGNEFGQGLAKIRRPAFIKLLSDLRNYQHFDRLKNRNQLILADLMAAENPGDFMVNGYRKVAAARNNKGDKGGTFLSYRHKHVGEFAREPIKEQEKLAVKYLLEESILPKLAINPLGVGYAYAKAAGKTARDAEVSGVFNTQFAGYDDKLEGMEVTISGQKKHVGQKGRFDNINDVIAAVKAGYFEGINKDEWGPQLNYVSFQGRGGPRGGGGGGPTGPASAPATAPAPDDDQNGDDSDDDDRDDEADG